MRCSEESSGALFQDWSTPDACNAPMWSEEMEHCRKLIDIPA
jgi:hypothetical protein